MGMGRFQFQEYSGGKELLVIAIVNFLSRPHRKEAYAISLELAVGAGIPKGVC